MCSLPDKYMCCFYHWIVCEPINTMETQCSVDLLSVFSASSWPISIVHGQRDICACLIQLIKLSSSIWIFESGVLDLHCKSILHKDDSCFSAQVYLSKSKCVTIPCPYDLATQEQEIFSLQFINNCSLASSKMNLVEYLTYYQVIYAWYSENMLYIHFARVVIYAKLAATKILFCDKWSGFFFFQPVKE